MSSNSNHADTSSSEMKNIKSKKFRSKLFRFFKFVFYFLIILFILLILIFLFFSKTDIGRSIINNKVENIVDAKIGKFADIGINGTHLVIDDDYHLAFGVINTSVKSKINQFDLKKIGHISVGFANHPLLKGKLKPIQFNISDTNLTYYRKDSKNNLLTLFPKDNEQRISFDGTVDAVYQGLEFLTQNIDKTSMNTVRMHNVGLLIKSQNPDQHILVKELRIQRLYQSLNLDGEILWQGKQMKISATAQTTNDGRVKKLSITIDNMHFHLGKSNDAVPYLINGRPNNGFFRLNGTAKIRLNSEITEKGQKLVAASLKVDDALAEVSIKKNIPAYINLSASYEYGRNQIDLHPSQLALGNLKLPISGYLNYTSSETHTSNEMRVGEHAIGGYNVNLQVDNGVSVPKDSPEAPLFFDVDILGNSSASFKRTELENIILKTNSSKVEGHGFVRFGTEYWPELDFSFNTAAIPVSEAKQLWPINVARGGRKWMMGHVFDGKLHNASMNITMPEGFRKKGQLPPLLTGKELQIKTDIKDTKTNLIGNLPSVQNASGHVSVLGTHVEINLDDAKANPDAGDKVDLSQGKMSFTWYPGKPLWADMDVNIQGSVRAIGKLLACDPVNAIDKIPFDTQKAHGNLNAMLKMRIPFKGVEKTDFAKAVEWSTDVKFQDFSLGEPYHGTLNVEEGNGEAHVDKTLVDIKGDALLNKVPASLAINFPLRQTDENGIDTNLAQKKEKIIFHVDDKLRNKLVPALELFLKGSLSADVGAEQNHMRPVRINLSEAALQIPWIGWEKGKGIPAVATMHVPMQADGLKNIDINDFELMGPHFKIKGKISIRNSQFVGADFSQFNLNEGDKLAVQIKKINNTYQVKLNGTSFDMRALINNLLQNKQVGKKAETKNNVSLFAKIDKVKGFNNVYLYNFIGKFNNNANGYTSSVNAHISSKKIVKIDATLKNQNQDIGVKVNDAGYFLRFMNLYPRIRGGVLTLSLASKGNPILKGPVNLTNFAVINEGKLKSLATSNKDRENTTSLKVNSASASIIKGQNYLEIKDGIMRGPSVGAVFQGTVFNDKGGIDMTGTYMPAYALNRIVGYVPIIGSLLGNGNDKGLIGLTFKLEGKFKSPKITVNPISIIAPGILRSIFEYR